MSVTGFEPTENGFFLYLSSQTKLNRCENIENFQRGICGIDTIIICNWDRENTVMRIIA